MNPHDAHEDEDKGESDFTVWNAPHSVYDYEDSASSESEGAVGDWSEGDEHLGAEFDDESADPDSENNPDETPSVPLWWSASKED